MKWDIKQQLGKSDQEFNKLFSIESSEAREMKKDIALKFVNDYRTKFKVDPDYIEVFYLRFIK
jgi:hypothetical protein